MQQVGNLKLLDKWARRALFLRRLGWTLLFLITAILVGIFSYQFWRSTRADVFDFPSYSDLDSASESYWADRMERDISYVKSMNVSETRKASRLRTLVNNQLEIAIDIDSYYDRNHAILSIALTLTKHDLDVNIDRTLRLLNETYESYSARARIYISIALMKARQKNLMDAMSAYFEYKRLVNHADLKLDTQENEEAFMGAVAILNLAQNYDELSELFQMQINFSRRINTSRRMRAYRIITVEQARCGNKFLPNSFNTFRMIQDTIESSRAFQLIITFVARPPVSEPVEPSYPTPQSDAPWTAIRNSSTVRNTINNLLKIIVEENLELNRQQEILKRIAGSILMCDPEAYKIFRSAIKDLTELDNTVKTSVLKLLDNPISDKIRAELKMPPRTRKKSKNNGEGIRDIDPARHDWIDDKDTIDIQITTIDAATLKSIDIRQYSRILTVAATAYLQVHRTTDAINTLQNAFNITLNQPEQTEQIRSLIAIAELQLDAGAINDATKTLKILNQKLNAAEQTENNKTENINDPQTNNLIDEQILNLVELQVIGRYFDDASINVQRIKSTTTRDMSLLLIARELLRSDQLDAAEKIIAQITDKTTQNEYKHRLIIAQTESKIPIQSAISIELPEQSIAVAGINNPMALEGDNNIARGASQLIRYGFYEAATVTAKRIKDAKLQSKLLSQIGREYVLVYNSYSKQGDQNLIASERAFDNAMIISEMIADIEQRITLTLSLINAMASNKRYDKDAAVLMRLFDFVMVDIERIEKRPIATTNNNVNNKNDKNNGDNNIDKNKNANDKNAKNSNGTIDLSQMSRGEIFSTALLSRVNVEILRNGTNKNNRNENYSEIWNNDLQVLTERVKNELDGEEATYSKACAIVNLALAFLRGGKLKEAAETTKLAETIAENLNDRSDTISIMINLMQIYNTLNDKESFAKIKNKAIDLAVSFIPPGIDIKQINLMWRKRDIELDRIMRKLIELDMTENVIDVIDNIHEPIIYDRIIKTIAYIQVNKKNFNAAETIAKKLKLPEYKFATLRDVKLSKNNEQ
jgi:hypothetical protein